MTKQPLLPSEKLMQPARPWRTVLLVLATVAVGLAAVFISGAVFKADTSRDGASIVHLVGEQGKPTTPQVTHKLLLTTHVAKSTTPPPPPPAPENYYGNPGPVQCPAGTTANAVDAYGNESACQANGPGGGQCVAYNDANQCTAYLQALEVTPLRG